MRTVGMLVLDRVAERMQQIPAYDHGRLGGYPVWEGIVFGLSNSEVAAMVLTEWRFPSEMISAVREHYLLRPEDYDNRLACLLNVAGRVVAEAGHTLPGDRRYWELSPRKLEIVGLREDQVHAAGERARIAFERLRSELH
jgi:HD-like signal output (HDOD) protein